MKTLQEVDDLLDMLTMIRFGEGIKYPEYPIFCSDKEYEQWGILWKNIVTSGTQLFTKGKEPNKVDIDMVVCYGGYTLLYIKTSNLKKQMQSV